MAMTIGDRPTSYPTAWETDSVYAFDETAPLEHLPQWYGEPRRCSHPGCSTVLSRYNLGSGLCFCHQDQLPEDQRVIEENLDDLWAEALSEFSGYRLSIVLHCGRGHSYNLKTGHGAPTIEEQRVVVSYYQWFESWRAMLGGMEDHLQLADALRTTPTRAKVLWFHGAEPSRSEYAQLQCYLKEAPCVSSASTQVSPTRASSSSAPALPASSPAST